MKKNGKKLLALVLCAAMCVSVLTGCEKDREEPRPTARTEQTHRPTRPEGQRPDRPTETALGINAYYDNVIAESSLSLYDDFTAIVSSSVDMLEGTYTIEEDEITLTFGEGTIEGYFPEPGVISVYDGQGLFIETDSPGFFPDLEEDRITAGGPAEENKVYKDLGDGTVRYYDYIGDVTATYPEWMYNLEDDLMPGSVLLADDSFGYVLVMNVTEEYWAYPGENEDYLLEVFNDQIADAYDILYSPYWECDEVTYLRDYRQGFMAVGEANIYGDAWDISVRAELYHPTNDGEIMNETMIRVFFYEYDNEDQFYNLKDNVKHCVAAVR